MTWHIFKKTDVFKMADVISITNNGIMVDSDFIKEDTEIQNYHIDGGYLEIEV